MLISVLEMIVPIAIAFSLGVMMRKLKLMDDNGCATIKSMVSKVLLPVILFNAFLFAAYSKDSMAIIIVFFIAMIAVLGIGFLMRRFIPDRAKYFPFVFATIEGGTIGYPLLAMLYGTRGTSDMAIIDVAHTVFLFLIAIPLMQAADGNEPDFKKLMKNAVLSPTFLAMVIGIALGLIGVDSWLTGSSVYGIYQSVISFLTNPAGMLIIVTLGFGISISPELMRPVLFTAFTRLATMAVFCAISSFVIFRFIPYSKETFVALMIAFSLPASYAIPIFGKFEGHKEYVSTTISFSTVLTLIVFIGLTIFAKM